MPSGHLWSGPPCLVAHKNSELRPSTTPVWLYYGSHLEHWQTSTPGDMCPGLRPKPGWRPKPVSSVMDVTRNWDFTLESCFAHFYCIISPSLCVTCVLLYWLFGEVSSNKPGIVESHKCVWVTRGYSLLTTLWAMGWTLVSFCGIHSGTQTKGTADTQEKLLHKHISSLCSCQACKYPIGQSKTHGQTLVKGQGSTSHPLWGCGLSRVCNSTTFHPTRTPPIFLLASSSSPLFLTTGLSSDS